MDKTGGPAFPSRGGMMFYVPDTARGEIEQAVAALDQQHSGLSLRDYFAAKALAAMIGLAYKDDVMRGAKGVPILAQFAYEYADAMIVERAK